MIFFAEKDGTFIDAVGRLGIGLKCKICSIDKKTPEEKRNGAFGMKHRKAHPNRVGWQGSRGKAMYHGDGEIDTFFQFPFVE